MEVNFSIPSLSSFIEKLAALARKLNASPPRNTASAP